MRKIQLLIIATIVCMSLGTVMAGDFYVGGEFTLQYSGDPITDHSTVNWWEVQAIKYSRFGTGQAYLALTATPNNVFSVRGYGYTYYVNDRLEIEARNDANGEMLADSRVMLAGYDWRDPFEQINMNNRLFVKRTALSVRGQIDANTTGSITIAPGQVLIKGQYDGGTYKLGGGWTNDSKGYTDSIDQRPVFSIYGEASLTPNLSVYGEYIDGGRYYAEATYLHDVYQVTARHGNISNEKIGQHGYEAELLDISTTYQLSPNLTITGGIGYYLSDYPGFGTVYGSVDFDRYHIGVSRHLFYEETVIRAGYNLDGTNYLGFDYTLENQKWNASLTINMW